MKNNYIRFISVFLAALTVIIQLAAVIGAVPFDIRERMVDNTDGGGSTSRPPTFVDTPEGRVKLTYYYPEHEPGPSLVVSILSDIGNHYQGKITDAVKDFIEKKFRQAAINNVKTNIMPKIRSINNELRTTYNLKNGMTIKEIEDTLKIRNAKFDALLKLKEGKAAIFKTAARGFDIVCGIYGFFDMGMNPSSGYKSSFLEFGVNCVRGWSNATAVFFPIPGASAVFSIPELILTSNTFVYFVNIGDEFVRESELGATVMGGLDLCADDLNKIGTSMWFPVMWIFINRNDSSNEKDMTQRLEQAKQDYEKKHGESYIEKKAKGATASANNVNAYKPNIYLYPEEDTPFDVRFDRPTLLTVTDPVYQKNGWQGTAGSDGRIETGDSVCDYLFYEAEVGTYHFQRKEGFFIPKDDRENSFREILKSYGLNEKETDDFILYWCDKLEEGYDYAMYPQLTETVDASMAVKIEPSPDSILRIWFGFVRNEIPEKEAVPAEFERSGFTVVEWGGFFFE